MDYAEMVSQIMAPCSAAMIYSGRERTRRQTSLSQAVFSSADTAFKRPRICFLRSAFCVSHISILLSKICDGPVLFLDGDII